MAESAEEPDKPEPGTKEMQEEHGEAPPAKFATVEAPANPWRKIGAYVGGALALVVGTAVATLAATHRTAVRENAAAYLNGVRDGVNWAGLLAGDDWEDDEDDGDFAYGCSDCAGMTLQYCPECHAVDPDA